MNPSRLSHHRVHMESLQPRLLFAIALDIVALHEFGHSLGLAHYADTPANSVMEAYYNPNYNKASLATDVAVVPNASDGFNNLLELFSDARIAANTTSWKDSLDSNAGNGTVNITFSFMPDGNKLDSNKRNVLFAEMNSEFGSPSAWQSMLAAELSRWAAVSTGNLSFQQVSDNGAVQGAAGAVQNDARFGDIRIGSHRFDGPGGVLAHAYYPPPNGGTTAGDAHFASEEDWFNGGALSALTVGTFVRQADGSYYCPIGEEHGHGHHDAEGATGAVMAMTPGTPTSLFGEGTAAAAASSKFGSAGLLGSTPEILSSGNDDVLGSDA